VTHVLLRGDPSSPGDPVQPGIPAVLDRPDQRFTIPPAGEGAKTTGRRKAFADWMTRSDNPLTSRVFVNRVWAAYFGSGIVSTMENFGTSGAPPSNPELLDWLATEFVNSGWRMKSLHRLIVTSSVYRQASFSRPEGLAKDPDNQFLWRMTPRRLESEAVRDAVLAVAGTMDAQMFGEPVPTETKKSGEVAGAGESGKGRRSVYQIVRRSGPQHFLSSFDAPVMEVNCIRRTHSTSATQALAMMNGDFVSAQAVHFAKRVLEHTPGEPADSYSGKVKYAFRLAFGREATPDEADLAASFLDRQKNRYPDLPASERVLRALRDFCQVLLGANEFVYLD